MAGVTFHGLGASHTHNSVLHSPPIPWYALSSPTGCATHRRIVPVQSQKYSNLGYIGGWDP